MRAIDAETLKKRIQLAPDKQNETWVELYDAVMYEIDNAPTIELTESDGDTDRFTIEELRAWLYENAINNYGTQYEKDVIEIISRLDGFVRFCKDRRTET